MKPIKRSQIEDGSKEELVNIGKAFIEEGHDVNLTANKVELRKQLLGIYDEFYTEEQELGEEEAEEIKTEETPTESIPDEPIPEAPETPAPTTPTKKAKKQDLYVARQGKFSIWIGLDKYEVFNPKIPRPLPDMKDKRVKEAIANAIAMKRIVKVE